MIKKIFLMFAIFVGVGSILAYLFYPYALWSLIILLPIILLGIRDMTQIEYTMCEK